MSIMGERIRQLRVEKDMTQEELGAHFGVQRAAVQKWESGQTKNLKRSVIEKLSQLFGVSPSYLMGMTDDPVPAVTYRQVPMLGEIAAGEPILAYEDCRAYVEVDGQEQVDFCLRVKGDSMVDAHIRDGDVVFVRKQPCVENGEIAVVLLDDEATLKRVYRTDTGIILKPENSKYGPTFISEADFKNVRILGKAVLLQTKL